VSVVGYSLSGFVDAPREEQSVDGEPAAGHVNQILSLQEQIDLVETRLRTYLRIVLVAGAGYPARIILVGHSVGAYIALEILRRWREREEAHARDVMIPEDQGQILGFIGLWPTVTWIGKSPNGRKAAVSLPSDSLEFTKMPNSG
jgi:pimeloyl-ACP methyl ester carboxylesterase